MRNLIALLIALPLAAAAQWAPPPEPPPPAPPPPAYYPAQPSPPGHRMAPAGRSPWYIGFGIGGGAGRINPGGSDISFDNNMDSPPKVFVNLKVGATITPHFLLGLDLAGFRTEGTVATGTYAGLSTARQISNMDAMVTWFPMVRGPFLRAGIGLSEYSVSLTGYQDSTLNGSNLTVGGGYAFWLGRAFNLTINLDYSAQRYGSNASGLTRSEFTALWFGFDWY
jgi:hypothetical protein